MNKFIRKSLLLLHLLKRLYLGCFRGDLKIKFFRDIMELMKVLEGCFLFGRWRFTSVFYGNALSHSQCNQVGKS